MRFVTAVGLVAVLGWAAGADDKKGEAKDDGKLDPAALVGTWEFTGGKKGGEKSDPEALKKQSFTVNKDGTAVLAGPDATFKLKYKVDAKANPVTIDFEITDGPFAVGEKAPGIIKLEKGTVTLAYAPMGGDRPKKFDDDKAHVFELKKKAEAKKDGPKAKVDD